MEVPPLTLILRVTFSFLSACQAEYFTQPSLLHEDTSPERWDVLFKVLTLSSKLTA